MKLYRMFRFKKYGEPYLHDQTTWSLHDDMDKYEFPSPIKEANSNINNQLAQLEQYFNQKEKKDQAISDLHTVKEDEYDDECDDEMNPAAFIHNKKEY